MWITFLNLTGYNDVHLYAPLRSFIRWGAEGLAPSEAQGGKPTCNYVLIRQKYGNSTPIHHQA